MVESLIRHRLLSSLDVWFSASLTFRFGHKSAHPCPCPRSWPDVLAHGHKRIQLASAADSQGVDREIALSQDAAIVLGLAGTALPYAGSELDEAERWLRALRLYGQVGAALQSLGVGEAPLETQADPDGARRWRRERTEDPVEAVTEHAQRFASLRESRAVGTVDVLMAVLKVYGKVFDRALYVRGASRAELLVALSAVTAPPPVPRA
jgi:hypothetical protein